VNHPFGLPNILQSEANALPSRAARAGTVYSGGQNQDIVGPWAREAQDIQPYFGTSPLSADAAGQYRGGGMFVPSQANPVMDMIDEDATVARTYRGEVRASQTLALGGGLGSLRSGSMSRDVRTTYDQGGRSYGALGPYVAEAYGSTNGMGFADPVRSDVYGSTNGLGYNIPVRQGALRTYSNAPVLGNLLYRQDVQTLGVGRLGAADQASCGEFTPGSAAWDDPRNPAGALAARFLAYGVADWPPAVQPLLMCSFAEIDRRLRASGIDAKEAQQNFTEEYKQARLNAGGVPLDGTNFGYAALAVGPMITAFGWSPSDVSSMVESALKVNWNSSEWLNEWADITNPPSSLPRVLTGESGAGSATSPWYTNPWVLGAGAAAVVGGVWWATK